MPWLALLVLLVGLFFVRENGKGPVGRGDEYFLDWLMTQGTPPARLPGLALVEINDSSLSAHNPWPWRPLDYSLFLKAVLPAKPGVVAIAPVLRWTDATVAYRGALENQILRTPKLLLAAGLGVTRDPESTPSVLPILHKVRGNLGGLPEYADVTNMPDEAFARIATLGAIATPANPGQRIRKLPLVLRYRGDAIPSFALQAMMLWLKLVPADVVLDIGHSVRLGDSLEIPIDEDGCLLINYLSLQPVKRVGFDDLLLSVEQQESGINPDFPLETLVGRIVLLGRTDLDSRVFPLPSARPGSFTEIQAAALATIQQRAFIRPAPLWLQLVLVGAAVVLSVVSWQVRRRYFLWITPVLGVAYAMLSTHLFGAMHLWMPAVMPYGLLLFVLVARLLTPSRSAGS